MKNTLPILAFSLFSLSGGVVAAPTIIGYNVTNAAPSGTGDWAHTYTGTIVDLGNGLEDYIGGTGTLADGVINNDVYSTQLFRIRDNTSITVFLDNYYQIESVSLFGGPTNNKIPGQITGATFSTLTGLSSTLSSTPFGPLSTDNQPVNDLFTSTQNPYINQFTISNITGSYYDVSATWDANFYSISEIQVSAVPEPSTYALMLGGLGLVGFMAFRRRRNLV